jgi:hypothetical protein
MSTPKKTPEPTKELDRSLVKVRFNESISCEHGSFAAGHDYSIEHWLAAPWLKHGTVTAIDKIEKTEAPTDTVLAVNIAAVSPKAPKTPKAPKPPKS